MPSTYQGKEVAIVSSTYSNGIAPIQVTATAHGYSTGDVVKIEGHLLNLPANGLFTITKVNANIFSLNGTVVTGNIGSAGGATGYVTSWVPLVTIPSDGDGPIKAADVNAAFEGLADRLRYGFRDLADRWAGFFRVPTTSIVRTVPLCPTADPAGWTPFDVGAAVPVWVNNALAGRLFIPVDLPHGSVWTDASVTVKAANASVPLIPMKCCPMRVHIATGARTTPAGFSVSTVDPTPGTAVHQIPASGGTEIVDRTTYLYLIELIGEDSTGANTGDYCYGAKVTFTVSYLDVGAS